ncbi:MAG: chaperone modulator CbpM [Chitinophagaceae bacterium]|nr:chaperone modulator CbpM [Chitinophagaceae bacterium]HRN48223.1 chaperone modulator CbpM [Niabella sp.]
MSNEKNISVEEYCTHYSIEASFVRSLSENGLIELSNVNESICIDFDQLQALEKYIHLHYDLDINIEGIEAISHLLQKIDSLQTELRILRNRLST